MIKVKQISPDMFKKGNTIYEFAGFTRKEVEVKLGDKLPKFVKVQTSTSEFPGTKALLEIIGYRVHDVTTRCFTEHNPQYYVDMVIFRLSR